MKRDTDEGRSGGLEEGEQRGFEWWGDEKDKAEARKIDSLPSMMCFLLRPLSVSALQQEKCMSRVSTHTQTHILMHIHASLMNRIRSLNMPNDSLYNKLTTNHWKEIHPLDSLQCVCRSRTKCAVGRHRADCHCLSSLLVICQWTPS